MKTRDRLDILVANLAAYPDQSDRLVSFQSLNKVDFHHTVMLPIFKAIDPVLVAQYGLKIDGKTISSSDQRYTIHLENWRRSLMGKRYHQTSTDQLSLSVSQMINSAASSHTIAIDSIKNLANAFQASDLRVQHDRDRIKRLDHNYIREQIKDTGAIET